MGNFFTLHYWFNIYAGSLQPIWQKSLLFAFTAFMIFSIAAVVFKNKLIPNMYRKLWARAQSFLIANTIISFLMWIFTFQGIPFFSARFWFLLWLIADMAWLYFIIRHARLIPEIRKKYEAELLFKKYIP